MFFEILEGYTINKFCSDLEYSLLLLVYDLNQLPIIPEGLD